VTTAVQVCNAITNAEAAALDARSGWTWAWAGDDATEVAWPGIDTFGGTAADLTPAGAYVLNQSTSDGAQLPFIKPSHLDARGAGSACINRAVLGGAGVSFEAAGFPNPGTATLHIRLVVSDPGTNKITGALTLFELSEAAQRVTIKREEIVGVDGLISVIRVETELGANVVDMPRVPFFAAWYLLDVVVDFATGAVKMFFSGIDVTPALGAAPGALTAFGGDPDVALMSKVGGTESAEFVSLLFAGVAVGRDLLISEHRADAQALGVLLDGRATSLDPVAELPPGDGIWTDAYVGDMAVVEADRATQWLPFDPFEDVSRALTVAPVGIDGLADVVLRRSTDYLRPEGLGRPRINRGVRRFPLGPRYQRRAAELALDLAQPFWVRLVVELDYLNQFNGPGASRTIFAIEDPITSGNRVTIKTNADLSAMDVEVTSAFTTSFAVPANAIAKWALIDLRYRPTSGGGGESRMEVWINGAVAADIDHTSALTNVFAAPDLTLLSLADDSEDAFNVTLSFAGINVAGFSGFELHQMAALSLGVY